MAKESSYQKLKRELKESKEKHNSLRNDFKKYVKGDFETITYYGVLFKMEDSIEQQIWYGNTNAE